MAELHIQILGGFSVLADGSPVPGFHQPRLQALLAYLLLNRQAPQSRQYIAFQFWPDSTEKQARNNLRRLLYSLRKALPRADSYLKVTTETLHWLADAPLELDVARFELSLTKSANAVKQRGALNALQEVAATTLPGDMTYSWNAMSFQEKAAEGSGAIIFVLALVFVFLILSAQYESWSLPLGVLLGTPIAVFGAMAGLFITGIFAAGYTNNVFAQIGLVMLIGMAAKNAILIIEFAKLKTEEGMAPREAALAAARDRFRPILMTAFSFILGVLPLLVASGAGAEARKVMGMTVFSGMLVATVIGVIVVPSMFIMVSKMGKSKGAAD